MPKKTDIETAETEPPPPPEEKKPVHYAPGLGLPACGKTAGRLIMTPLVGQVTCERCKKTVRYQQEKTPQTKDVLEALDGKKDGT